MYIQQLSSIHWVYSLTLTEYTEYTMKSYMQNIQPERIRGSLDRNTRPSMGNVYLLWEKIRARDSINAGMVFIANKYKPTYSSWKAHGRSPYVLIYMDHILTLPFGICAIYFDLEVPACLQESWESQWIYQAVKVHKTWNPQCSKTSSGCLLACHHHHWDSLSQMNVQ